MDERIAWCTPCFASPVEKKSTRSKRESVAAWSRYTCRRVSRADVLASRFQQSTASTLKRGRNLYQLRLSVLHISMDSLHRMQASRATSDEFCC
jgi:hypothetical protein